MSVYKIIFSFTRLMGVKILQFLHDYMPKRPLFLACIYLTLGKVWYSQLYLVALYRTALSKIKKTMFKSQIHFRIFIFENMFIYIVISKRQKFN